MFAHVTPTAAERAATRPGDELVATADVVMNRGFTVPGTPDEVWPWLQQLGKGRAGWYLPRWVERGMPRRRRAIRHIDAGWQLLAVGDAIRDYGGRDETFDVAALAPGRFLVYTSQRGKVALSWSITLTPLTDPADPDRTRVHLRLRLGPVRHTWLAATVGEFVDLLTIAGMATGLQQRLEKPSS